MATELQTMNKQREKQLTNCFNYNQSCLMWPSKGTLK